MQTVWVVAISLAAALNLHLILPGVLARSGLWKFPASV
jgi:hypothetical protein